MIRAIIFDWFGVCVERWISVWQRELGSNANPELLERFFLRQLDAYASNLISGPQFLERVFNDLGLDPNGYGYLLTKLGQLNFELLDLIEELRRSGYKTAVLSDNFNEIVPVIETKIGGFERYFDIVCLSNRLGISKSSIEIFLKVGEQLMTLGIEGTNCVFVDDRQNNLDMAKEVGWKPILYRDNGQLLKTLLRQGIAIHQRHSK